MNTSYAAYEEFRDDPAVDAALRRCQQLERDAVDEEDWWNRAVHLFANADDDDAGGEIFRLGISCLSLATPEWPNQCHRAAAAGRPKWPAGGPNPGALRLD